MSRWRVYDSAIEAARRQQTRVDQQDRLTRRTIDHDRESSGQQKQRLELEMERLGAGAGGLELEHPLSS